MKIGNLSKSLALAAPLLALTPAEVRAAAYIKFDGIDGEAIYGGNDGYIKIGDWKVEIDGTQASPDFSDSTVGFNMDKASPRLMLACASGFTIPSATVTFTRPDGSGQESAYLIITMTNVKVKTYKNQREESNNTPVEAITLGYTEVEWTYIVRNSSGAQIETVSSGTFTR